MALNSLYCADVPLSNYSLTDLSNEPYAITTAMINYHQHHKLILFVE